MLYFIDEGSALIAVAQGDEIPFFTGIYFIYYILLGKQK